LRNLTDAEGKRSVLQLPPQESLQVFLLHRKRRVAQRRDAKTQHEVVVLRVRKPRSQEPATATFKESFSEEALDHLYNIAIRVKS
jgi:hypothetical protein